MKQVLSLLTAFIVLQTQSWALSGGPVYPTGAPNVAGIYSGVMVQRSARFGTDLGFPNSGTNANEVAPAGNIGVYTLTIPTSGLSSGNLLIFINGTIFNNGTIDGVADPDSGDFQGVIQASANFLGPNNSTITVLATGQMKVKIIEQLTTPLPGRTDTSAGSAARMKGSATIDAFTDTNFNLTPIPNVQTRYSVSGFRQIATALP